MQQRDYSCGAAALATLIRYHLGDPMNEEYILRQTFAMSTAEEIKEIGFTGQLGPVGYQATYSRSRDNLEDIETILTTQTSSTQLSMNTSLKELFAKRIPDTSRYYKLLPALSFSAQRVHQYNLNSPENLQSDFNDNSHLPNQVNLRN